MKVGISSWTFPWAIGVKGYPPRHPLNGLGLLEKARTLGAQVVQIADNLQVDGSSVAALRKAASGMDLELGTRDVSPDNLLAYLEHAVALGARLVRALPCGPSDLFGAIRSVVGEFERQGVLLALENYEQLSVADLLGLIRRLDSPCVGICLDTVNSLGRLETPGCVIKMLAPFTVNLHVKDFDIVRVPHQMGSTSLAGPPAWGVSICRPCSTRCAATAAIRI